MKRKYPVSSEVPVPGGIFKLLAVAISRTVSEGFIRDARTVEQGVLTDLKDLNSQSAPGQKEKR